MELTGVCPLSKTAVEEREADILYCGGTVVTSAGRLTFRGCLFCGCDSVGGENQSRMLHWASNHTLFAAFMLILTKAAKLRITSSFSVAFWRAATSFVMLQLKCQR